METDSFDINEELPSIGNYMYLRVDLLKLLNTMTKLIPAAAEQL